MPHKTYSAVFPIILSEDGKRILLHLRQNTGYRDGHWDTAGSGHVEASETAKEAAIRECNEEIGVDVKAADLEFAHLTHHFSESDQNYYHIYFVVKDYEGTPRIMEPEKCSELGWFDVKELPEPMIPCRRMAVESWLDGGAYTEVEDQ